MKRERGIIQVTTNNIQKAYEDSQRVSDPEAFLAKFTNCKVLSTAEQDVDEEAWLAARTKGIGGSDIGTICGVNKYSTPRLLYFKKTGQYEDSETMGFSEAAKERMHFGHKLEPVVADEYVQRTGKRAVICPATLQHKDYPWALANIDRVLVDENDTPYGLLEIKTADARLLKDWENGDMPTSYIYQLQWYLFVTNLEYGAFAALIGGNRFVMIEVWRNDALIHEEMVPKADTFWNYNVRNMIVPEVTGVDADGDMNKELYANVEKDTEAILEDAEDYDLAQYILESKAEIKRLETEVKKATFKLQTKIGTKERGVTPGHIISWKPVTTKRVDSDTLKTEYPEVYAACVRPSTYRRFTIKGVEE